MYLRLNVVSGPNFTKSFKHVPDLTYFKEPDCMQEAKSLSFKKLDSPALWTMPETNSKTNAEPIQMEAHNRKLETSSRNQDPPDLDLAGHKYLHCSLNGHLLQD